VSHNTIQSECSGPDFAVGEVYGLRQWGLQKSSMYRRTYGLPPGTHPFTRSVSLTGHFSKSWDLAGNKAQCFASQSYSQKLHVSAKCPPTNFLAEAAKRSAHPDLYLVDVMLCWAERLLALNGVSPRDVHRLEINGGRRGGTIIATANGTTDSLLVTYTDLGEMVFDGVSGFVQKSSHDSRDRYLDEYYNFATTPGLAPGDDILLYSVNFTANANCSSIAQPSCTCGFYAYNNVDSLVENSYTQDSSVFGLVRGYGKVTIGSKGFRAEKADIVALAEPVAFRRTSMNGHSYSQWHKTTFTKENAQLMRECLESTDVKVFASPEELFAYARVHISDY